MSFPRLHSHPNPYDSTRRTSTMERGGGGGRAGRLPRIFKRMFKFPQMDFEVAVWEMTSLIIAPRKVFRNMYYHKQTKNTFATADPAFLYLLSFFLLLTSLAWSLAEAQLRPSHIFQIAAAFVLLHCLLGCLFVGTICYFAVPRLFGKGGALRRINLPGLRPGRRRGLFGVQVVGGAEEMGMSGSGEELEFGFCFDVSELAGVFHLDIFARGALLPPRTRKFGIKQHEGSSNDIIRKQIAIRSFFPLWIHLYALQFLLLPLLTSHRWLPAFLSNTLHALALLHSLYITFLGYSTSIQLTSGRGESTSGGGSGGSGTPLLLAGPTIVIVVFWSVACLTGWNATKHLAPVLWCGSGLLRGGGVGGGR
ncbi:MAG: Protein unc-50 [Alyxoria varia]|nr:MAG: Protein unc-50 [Alyxoria varia]